MQKRKFDRIYQNLKVKFFCDDILCSGVLINFSEKGMLIRTKMSFPFEWRFDIFILLSDKFLKVPVEIVRLSKADKHYDILALEVLGHQEEYETFVSTVKSFYSSFSISESEFPGRKRSIYFSHSRLKRQVTERNIKARKSKSTRKTLTVVNKKIITGSPLKYE